MHVGPRAGGLRRGAHGRAPAGRVATGSGLGSVPRRSHAGPRPGRHRRILDVVRGTATSVGEAHHVLDLAGVAVLWMVAREERGQPTRTPPHCRVRDPPRRAGGGPGRPRPDRHVGVTRGRPGGPRWCRWTRLTGPGSTPVEARNRPPDLQRARLSGPGRCLCRRFGPDGEAGAAGHRRASNAPTVEIDLQPDLPDGTYVISYRVVSADGHPVRGASVFGVGPDAIDEGAVGQGSPTAGDDRGLGGGRGGGSRARLRRGADPPRGGWPSSCSCTAAVPSGPTSSGGGGGSRASRGGREPGGPARAGGPRHRPGPRLPSSTRGSSPRSRGTGSASGSGWRWPGWR